MIVRLMATPIRVRIAVTFHVVILRCIVCVYIDI